MSCAVIARELAAKYDTLYLAAFNQYFAEALADELDNVRVIDQAEIASFWNTHYDKVQDNFIAEPYNLSDFSMRRIHFYDAYRKVIGLDEKHDWNENGTSTLPKLVVPKAMQNSAFEFSEEDMNIEDEAIKNYEKRMKKRENLEKFLNKFRKNK